MSLPNSNILIVDDDPDVREMLKDRLEFLSHDVRTAVDGLEGLSCIQQEQPDLVLLDLQMPRMDGLSFLRKLGEERPPHPPVVVITAHATVEIAVEAIRCGAEDILLKPFDPEAVEKGLDCALERVRLRRENERLQLELEEAHDLLINEMQKDLQIAHDMQVGLLPSEAPEFEGFDISGICIPATYVGGDYYHYHRLDPHRLAIIQADVTGKGIQAATVAMRFNEMVRYEVKNYHSSPEFLEGLDESLRGQIPDQMFVTCGIGVLDSIQRRFHFTSAGNPEVYHYRAADHTVRPLQVNGIPLGIPFIPIGITRFNTVSLELEEGDLVVLTSDGVGEARNEAEDFYGEVKFQGHILRIANRCRTAQSVRNEILTDVIDFMGDRSQVDDVTVIVVRAT